MTTRHAYIDGNNNTYEIGERLDYVPITPAQSSSGMYSGGEPKSVVLDAERRAEILALLERIEADRDNVLAQRPKGCGTVIRGEHTTFVRADSSLKLELERLLKSLL